ncbi:MAG: DUF2924 domain-containing protein [Planctomycetota bacterium]
MATTTYEDNPQRLKELSVDELRRLWEKRMGAKPVPKVKGILLRELAWHLQEQAQGGIDTETRTLLRSAVRQSRADHLEPVKQKRPPRVRLEAGARLVRVWRGTKHEVLVLEGGKRFEYRGKVYRSLTPVTEEITGSHWSGPRFFGLHKAVAANK